jgi:hypothetical protein
MSAAFAQLKRRFAAAAAAALLMTAPAGAQALQEQNREILKKLILGTIAIAAIAPAALQAQPMVPFEGHWSGVTVSADLSAFPVVGVVSEGEGQASHLGRYTMVSPHTSDVFTGETIGEQIFTAANGDTLTAHCEGFPLPQLDGTVVGTLDCTITSGEGRFAGATGGYYFFLVATPQPGVFPPIFETEATIMGWLTP